MTDEDSRSRTSTGSSAGAEGGSGKALGPAWRGEGREFASLLPKTTFKFFGAPLCCDKP